LTPGALARLGRLQAARVEVLGGERPLAEIALDHGFHDQAHFTTAYRLWTGVTPGVDRTRASPDVVFLQDRSGWVPLTDRMIEVG
jgi:AraC-like DNA-binding protein